MSDTLDKRKLLKTLDNQIKYHFQQENNIAPGAYMIAKELAEGIRKGRYDTKEPAE